MQVLDLLMMSNMQVAIAISVSIISADNHHKVTLSMMHDA